MATPIPAPVVAAEVLRQGGTMAQAWVAAALVSGIESNGDPTELSGGVGPAAGLFQFEPGTWRGNGGSAFANVAQDATWQQQVTVFLHASAGNNFHDWGPDLTGTGNPNSASNPAYSYSGGPQPGSPVANKIADLSASGALKFLTDPSHVFQGTGIATGGTEAGTPTPNPFVNAPSGVAGVPSLGWADALGHLLSDLVSTNWWKRVGIFSLGGVLVIGGIILFVSTTKTGQRVESEAVQAGEVAAVA